MEIASEQDTNKGKSSNKNPLAFLGLKRVDIEDEDDDDKKSDDYDVEGKDIHFLILISGLKSIGSYLFRVLRIMFFHTGHFRILFIFCRFTNKIFSQWTSFE